MFTCFAHFYFKGVSATLWPCPLNFRFSSIKPSLYSFVENGDGKMKRSSVSITACEVVYLSGDWARRSPAALPGAESELINFIDSAIISVL